ncbi:MAG: aspartate/glutamate racemase family protein [Candidatus Bathyarchaeota archaeon]|jgi:maleate isomerase
MRHTNTFRIGLLVPSSNTTMEPDLHRMTPPGVSVHTARMRLEEVKPQTLIQMAEDTEKASVLLATADPDIIIYGCTTGSLVGGTAWEKTLVKNIRDHTGIPALSTSHAVIEALKLFGGNIGVATPYSEELNKLEKEFLDTHGLQVAVMQGLGLTSNLEIGRTPTETTTELVQAVSRGADTIFISCTNLPAIDLIERLEREHGLPVVTSNQATLWATLKRANLKGIDGYGQLLRDYL